MCIFFYLLEYTLDENLRFLKPLLLLLLLLLLYAKNKRADPGKIQVLRLRDTGLYNTSISTT